MLKIKINIIKHNQMLIYLLNSIIVTFLDIFIVWIANRYLSFGLVAANTIGVVSGFIVHYILSSRKVFNENYGLLGFLIYFGTFIIGVVLADLLIYVGSEFIFFKLGGNINFLFSKGISLVGPFFIMYYLRKFLYNILDKYKSKLAVKSRGEKVEV